MKPSEIKKLVATTRLHQKKLVAAQKTIDSKVAKLEETVMKIFDDLWKKTFPDKSVFRLAGFHGGCHTDKWEPEVFLYDIHGIYLTSDKHWVDVDGKPTDAPVELSKLRWFQMKFQTLSGGIPVKIVHPTIS